MGAGSLTALAQAPSLPDGPVCGPACWRAAPGDADAARAPPAAANAAGGSGSGAGPSGSSSSSSSGGSARPPPQPWSAYELLLLDKGVQMFANDACRVARLVGSRSCAAVKAELAARGLDEPAAVSAARAAAVRAARVATRVNPSTVAARSRKPKNQLWGAYTPCSCEGACEPGSCDCAGGRNFWCARRPPRAALMEGALGGTTAACRRRRLGLALAPPADGSLAPPIPATSPEPAAARSSAAAPRRAPTASRAAAAPRARAGMACAPASPQPASATPTSAASAPPRRWATP